MRKHQALRSEHTALLSWSLAVNTVMPAMQRDLGNLTSLYMQPIATAQHLRAGLHTNVSASSTVFYGLFQTLTVKYISDAFPCVSDFDIFLLLKKVQLLTICPSPLRKTCQFVAILVLTLFQSIENNTTKTLPWLMIIYI